MKKKDWAMKAMQDGEYLSNPDFIAERKYDGTRILALKKVNSVRLIGRSGKEYTKNFPLIVSELKQMPFDFAVDGEIVYLDKKGDDNFDEVAKRIHIEDKEKIKEYTKKYPVKFFVFDIMEFDGRDLTDMALSNRKMILEDHFSESAHVEITEYKISLKDKKKLLKTQERLNREGVMYKNMTSPYIPGARTGHWRKHKFFKEDSTIVIGYQRGKGKLNGLIGALYTAQLLPTNQLWYTGKIGTGMEIKKKGRAVTTNQEIKALFDRIKISFPKGVVNSSFLKKIKNMDVLNTPEIKEAVWVLPVYVIDIKYMEVSKGGRFRHGSFLRLRRDLLPKDVRYKGK